MHWWCIPFIFAAIACSHAKAKPETPTTDPPPAVVENWGIEQDRALTFASDGFIVSLDKNQVTQNQGDSLIWTGVALASMDCQHGAKLDQALQAMVKTLNGGLWRHPSIPNDVSLDGALGFYLGVTHRITHCMEGDIWAPLLKLHQAAGSALNPNGGTKLEDPFTAARDAVLSLVGIADYPGAVRIGALSEAAALMGAAPGIAHRTGVGSQACYRAHLGLLVMQIIEATGGKPSARNSFCAATVGYDLPTTDQYCGRGNLRAWTEAFQSDVWQYRHQRCPGWENPDGDGLLQPGIDLLRGLVDAYGFKWN